MVSKYTYHKSSTKLSSEKNIVSVELNFITFHLNVRKEYDIG